MDLLSLLQRPEGKTLEFKRDLSSPDGILRTAVAFANTSGGVLLVGVEDRTKHVRGIGDPLDVEGRLANLLSDSISPKILPDIEILPFRRTHVVALQVYPSATRPHYLKRDTVNESTYVRVGSTNRRADAELIAEMQRFTRGEAFDERPIPELNPEAIDFRAASESFAPIRKLARRDLAALGLIRKYQGKEVPSVGGTILFGEDRLNHFPDAWIQVGRFGGTDKTTVSDRASLRMYPAKAIPAAIEFIEKHSTQGASIGSVYRTEIWNLPPAAVREAVINAVAHADYSQRSGPIRVSMFDDRLEIENPGLLPFGLTVEDLERGVSKLRNRVIGRVFNELGLVEQWGSGIQRMTAACKKAGLSAPILEEIGNRFRVTLRTARIGNEVVDPIDRRILQFVATPEGRGTQAIANHIGLTSRATRTRLHALLDAGLIGQLSTGPSDPKRKYFRIARQS